MGQSNSRPPSSASSPQNALPANPPFPKPLKNKPSAGGLAPKGSTAAAAPVPSLQSAIGQSSQAQPPAESRSSHSRTRSQTIPAPRPPPLDPKSQSPQLPQPQPVEVQPRSPPPLSDDGTIVASSAPADLEPIKAKRSEPLGYVGEDLPTPPYGPFSQFGRPPRLPLPIEEEPLEPGSPTPGSPAIGPEDFRTDPTTGEVVVERSRSVLSANTLDEEDEVEDVIYRADSLEGPTVDTLIEWKEGGDKVYLTGTFCGWAKKSRLHKNGPSKDPNAFSAIVALPPGTLYLAFLVDGFPRTAKHLPTTVDYTNVLVNYIRVPADGTQPVLPGEVPQPQPSVPQNKRSGRSASQPAPVDTRAATETEPPKPAQTVVPTRTPSRKHKPTQSTNNDSDIQPNTTQIKKKPDTRKYHSEIPQFLLDWDAPENSSRVRRANAVSSSHQPPPLLPPYLQKSILSIPTPLKDDASVLTLPNHTTINHLATSSIKDGTLGTSATTRYKRKSLIGEDSIASLRRT